MGEREAGGNVGVATLGPTLLPCNSTNANDGRGCLVITPSHALRGLRRGTKKADKEQANDAVRLFAPNRKRCVQKRSKSVHGARSCSRAGKGVPPAIRWLCVALTCLGSSLGSGKQSV